jgi:hypothetical protein
MRELMRTNDLVLISAVEALLAEDGISCLIADSHISAIEGMIGAFPRRILVLDDDLADARHALREAGLGHELPADCPE